MNKRIHSLIFDRRRGMRNGAVADPAFDALRDDLELLDIAGG